MSEREGTDLITRLERALPGLSPGRRRIARFILDHLDEAAFLSAQALAQRAGTSEALVVRLAGELGFQGYSGLRRAMAEAFRHRFAQRSLFRLQHGVLGQPLERVRDQLLGNLEWTWQQNDPESLALAARLILNARTVALVGSRLARVVCIELYFALHALVAKPLCQVGPAELPDGLSGLTPQDCVVAAGFAHYDPRLVFAVRDAARRGIPIVAITDSRASPLACEARVALLARPESPSAELTMVAPLAVVQLLLAEVIRQDPEGVRQRYTALAELARAFSREVVVE